MLANFQGSLRKALISLFPDIGLDINNFDVAYSMRLFFLYPSFSHTAPFKLCITIITRFTSPSALLFLPFDFNFVTRKTGSSRMLKSAALWFRGYWYPASPPFMFFYLQFFFFLFFSFSFFFFLFNCWVLCLFLFVCCFFSFFVFF